MAKGKPSRAFLEALKPNKKSDKKPDAKRPIDDKSGGGFKTPEWFFNKQESEGASSPAAAGAPRSPMGLGLAPTSKPFRFNWVHGTGLGVVLLGVILVAYMAGKQQQPPQFGQSSEDIRQSPPQGGVLDPVRTAVVAPSPIAVAVQGGPVALSSESGARIIGMNYVVIQSYKDRPLADEAAAAMVAGGLGCTVEPGLAGYSAT